MSANSFEDTIHNHYNQPSRTAIYTYVHAYVIFWKSSGGEDKL